MASHNNEKRQMVQRVYRLTLGEKISLVCLVIQVITLIKIFLCR
jgi:hypothetical protein